MSHSFRPSLVYTAELDCVSVCKTWALLFIGVQASRQQDDGSVVSALSASGLVSACQEF